MQEIDRIRRLENRMRQPSKQTNQPKQEQSPISMKSQSDKKQYVSDANQRNIFCSNIQAPIEQQIDQEQRHVSNEIVSQNHTITQYFQNANYKLKSQIKNQKRSQHDSESQQQKFNQQQDGIDMLNLTENEALKYQNKILRNRMKQKQQYFKNFKDRVKKELTAKVITIHNMQRSQLRRKISHNKIRLGQYFFFKKGQETWVDGGQLRQAKQKLQQILQEKQQIQKLKRSQPRKITEEVQQRKNALICQSYFISKEEAYYNQLIKRLEDQKVMHIKQYKLLMEEQYSKYGKVNPSTGTQIWPKIKNYQLLCLLGKGGFSQVYKGFDTQELREVAIKIHQFSTSWSDQTKQIYIKHALRENAVHKMLHHPTIVKLYDTVQIDMNSFCTVLQFCEGPDLSSYLKRYKRLQEKQAKSIIRQIIMAIKYINELPNKIVHYDLKPQNILFHKGRVKITDFGLCKTMKDDVMELTSQGVGTYWYLPPQCFFTEEKPKVSPKVDVWSLGVIYFQMLFGQKPFGENMSQKRIMTQGIMLKATQINFPQTPKGVISNESKKFIEDCLKWQMQERADIFALYNHPLFEKKKQVIEVTTNNK